MQTPEGEKERKKAQKGRNSFVVFGQYWAERSKVMAAYLVITYNTLTPMLVT